MSQTIVVVVILLVYVSCMTVWVLVGICSDLAKLARWRRKRRLQRAHLEQQQRGIEQ